MKVIGFLVVLTSIAHADDPFPVSIPTVMDRRWSFSMGNGASRMTPDDTSIYYLCNQQSLRYRTNPFFEIGTTIGIGGTTDFFHAMLLGDLRLHWFPEHSWDVVMLASMGGATASYTLRRPYNALRPTFRFGGGVERRFLDSWGASLEAYGFYIDKNSGAPVSGRPERRIAGSSVTGTSIDVFVTYYWGRGPRTHRLQAVP